MNSILLLALMFQFTHPGRGATVVLSEPTIAELVSIHAPREGCDRTAPRVGLWEKCFNSRTPGGVRPLLARRRTHSNGFQFTHPGRGATDGGRLGKQRRGVSIHAPREGCDVHIVGRSPARTTVSIHAPREGCDYKFNPFRLLAYQFQFTHPGRGATFN